MHKATIIYSSRTGNTKLIAEAVAQGLQAPVLNAEAVDSLPTAQLLVIGFWVDKGTYDPLTSKVLELVKKSPCKVALFATLGGDPTSARALQSMQQVRDELQAQGSTVVASKLWRGKIDPKITEMMEHMMPHLKTDPQHLARVKEASLHPNATDLAEAQAFGALLRTLV